MKGANLTALMFSLLLILAAQSYLFAQTPAPVYVELNAVQLDQLVAPIALDPDSLVAQILTASTYLDQVAAANTWLNQNMNLPPDQRAAAANDKSWDPAVKGLTAFPAVLDTLAKNTGWTSQLGNAYYNQPGDVMNAVQAMRLQAQQLNVLVTTAQQRVIVEAGLIEIVPVNPSVIYVPYYNPWRVWGTLFVSYPGFVVLPPPSGVVWGAGLGFDPGIAVGPYADFDWGFSAWAPAWGDGVVAFNHNTYISNSRTVANHGHFGGHDRGVFEHSGHGVPGGFRVCAHAGAARAAHDRAAAIRKPSPGHRQLAHHSVPVGHPRSASHSASAHHMPGAEHPFPVHSKPSQRVAPASHKPPSGRSASAPHSASHSRSASADHSRSAPRSASRRTQRGAERPAPARASGRTASASHYVSKGHPAPVKHSAAVGRPASANRSASASRPASASRSALSGRFPSSGLSASARGSASAGRSNGGRSSAKAR